MHWWEITPTINLFEVADLLLALAGLLVSAANLSAARQRLREWLATGRNGLVVTSARARVTHEWMRLGVQCCFVAYALLAMQTRGVGPTIVALHACLLTAIALTLATSVSSWRARAAMEREGHG
jgi:hypothetical protein